MSDFNTANKLAAELVWGRTYQGDEPCFKPRKIVFHVGLNSEDKIVVEDDGQTDWAAVANRIHALLRQGYDYRTLPCEYCGATELEDVLHCEECGEPILHGYECAGVDEDGEKVTRCHDCYESKKEPSAGGFMSHFCEFDAYTNGRLGIEPCGEPAVAEWRRKWYCHDHLDSMEAHAGLMDELDKLRMRSRGE